MKKKKQKLIARTNKKNIIINKDLPFIAISEGSRIWSLQSNQLSRSPVSPIMNTVGDTLSTATIRPWLETARPATISMYLKKSTQIIQ